MPLIFGGGICVQSEGYLKILINFLFIKKSELKILFTHVFGHLLYLIGLNLKKE